MKFNSPLLLILLGFIFAVIASMAFKKQAISLLGGFNTKETVIERDTTYLPIKIDTTALFNHYVEVKGINLNPDPIIKYVYADKNEWEVVDSTKVFNIKVKDSLIDGTFNVTNDFKGNVLKSNFKYLPLFPKYITKTIPIEITKTVTNTITNDKVLYGAGIGINSEAHFSANISIIDKKKFQYQLEYTRFNLNNNLFPVKEAIGIKINKFF